MNNAKENLELVVSLRLMEEADLAEVVRLERDIFPDPWPRSAFVDLLDDDRWHTLIAESDGKLIGYACYLAEAEECHLANIAVHADYRRKSVAKQILGHILEVAAEKGCEEILLEVRVSNQQAISFYRGFGFEELQECPGYYHSPRESAQVMVLNLNPASDGV